LEKTQRLLFCLFLTVSLATSVFAVTDAELEALEKQIAQEEAKVKKQADTEKKAKAEAKRKAEAKAEKKRLADIAQKKKEADLKQLADNKCAPRILPVNPSAFPDVSQLIYNNPAFQNNPAPKVKWWKHNQKYKQDTDDYSSRSNGELNYKYLGGDGVVDKRTYKFNSDSSYTHHEDSQYNSKSQSSNSGSFQSIVLGLLSIQGEGEYTDGEGVQKNTASKATITKVDGKLFPLKQGNKLYVEYNLDYPPYKSQYKNKYSVTEVFKGENLNMGLTCQVFVIVEQQEKYSVKVDGDWEDTSTSKQEHYFSEQLGIVVKNVQLDVDYESVTVLVDYKLLPELEN
jgi:hypothetical protein